MKSKNIIIWKFVEGYKNEKGRFIILDQSSHSSFPNATVDFQLAVHKYKRKYEGELNGKRAVILEEKDDKFVIEVHKKTKFIVFIQKITNDQKFNFDKI
jgi:hypothetical protein